MATLYATSIMAQELDTEFSDAPTSESNGTFVPLEEIEHDPKQVEELVNKLQQVVQKGVHGNACMCGNDQVVVCRGI